MDSGSGAAHKRLGFRAWRVLLPCGLAVLVFLALGVWQLQRLQWKTDLIARVGARLEAAPSALPLPAQWPALNLQSDEYRRVQFAGRWDPTLVWVQSGSSEGWGYWVLRALQPAVSAEPHKVWVNLGFVAEADRARVELLLKSAPLDLQAGVGLIRWSEREPPFRHNDPSAGRWYSRDVAGITQAAGMDARTTAPWFIDAQTLEPALAGGPQGGLTVVHFNNNHAMYALTWFVLAVLSGVAGWIVLKFSRSSA